jgi:hypothetical protein
MKFHIFADSADRNSFAATPTPDTSVIPASACKGKWTPFKDVDEAGRPRIAFSESAARKDIEEKGFHLFRVKIEVKVQ